ncbi:MAG: hypothetical protein C4617_04790 [Candidatus Liberibacter europaeus]|uniref:GmrSD restriction endonucleases N-terminal domain-containing protein n=1 Tax=Candidatus Liberibacter europaeus TaxID=744859 RepID=A0A2T4VWQ6_9HYPH|nr:hypothetical protein [Candidatus Liberibacter europaeus]PTL86190.1 MAG: hypothetical protein C4617_04790 [Candidatus Liberibacter europaeus]
MNLEEQVGSLRKKTTYRILEYPIETILEKYNTKQEEIASADYEHADTAIYVPWYQRRFIWNKTRQSKFIESVFMDLPIPYVFLADIGRKDAFLEIIDGRQRIETLNRFVRGQLKIQNLGLLKELSGLYFKDFPVGMQRRFLATPLRAVMFLGQCDEQYIEEIFTRLNLGVPALTLKGFRRKSSVCWKNKLNS